MDAANDSHKQLDRIGYSTLSDHRAMTASATSPISRGEMILTNRCNFACPYCNGLPPLINRPMTWKAVQAGLAFWIQDGLQNVRFTGGEPTLHPRLLDAVKICRANGVPRIGITSNGSNRLDLYQRLLEAGLNHLSISLDAPNPSLGDRMAGGIPGAWQKVVSNIRALAPLTDVIVNIVYNEANLQTTLDTILLAHDLGVKDILLVADSRYEQAITGLEGLPQALLDAHPILKYRIGAAGDRPRVRGLTETDARRCALVLDDVMIAGDYHFPCSIYMREGGSPIGRVSAAMRQERCQWFLAHDSFADPICARFCVNLYIDYNNAYARFQAQAGR